MMFGQLKVESQSNLQNQQNLLSRHVHKDLTNLVLVHKKIDKVLFNMISNLQHKELSLH